MNESAIVFKVEDLSISFRSGESIQRAVEHISFEVSIGKTLAIVGESGSGKTVSSLSMMSLLQKGKVLFDSGTFRFNTALFSDGANEEIALAPTNELLRELRGRGISMIFQEPMTSLNPVMRCGEQVAEMMRLHLDLSTQEAWSRTLELFKEVKLPRPETIIDQYPHQLSGGQRQRVMIAMAISCRPKILIADEPTTALDVTVQKDILALLKELQQKYGMSMLFITHDLGVVSEIADDVIVMSKGRIVEQGPAKEVLHHPQHSYTKGLLACRPEPGKKSSRLLTLADFVDGQKPSAISEEEKTEEEKKETSGFALMKIDHVSKVYAASNSLFRSGKKVVAVDNVSFDIFKGETLGLVGESGCGKTTLSRMLLGLIPVSEGNIIYQSPGNPTNSNIPLLSQNQLRRLRKEIQIIFQDPYSSLNPKHTVGQALTEPMFVNGLHGSDIRRKQVAIELLQKVGLGSTHFDRYPHEFSGGQRQRIVIARALACEPSFVICDESVSALDVSVQAQVLNLLNDLKREFGLTYLFISHDLNVVYHMSDRIMVMNKGRIEEMGTSDEVFFHPKSDYTQKLLSSIPGRAKHLFELL